MTFALVAYRNPAEEWLWESGAIAWAALAFLVLISVCACAQFIEWLRRK